MDKQTRDRRGIQSIEVGGQLLLALGRAGTAMLLRDLAREAGMTPAKAHPYLVSFSKLGLVEQDPATGRYDLGPQALQLGLVSLQRLDPIRIASVVVADLAARTGHSIAIAVWGSHGPTIVRVEESSYPLHVNLRTGSVMSLLNTATGLAFAAYMPPKAVEGMLLSEPGRIGGGAGKVTRQDLRDLEARLADIREHGMARADGTPIPGINAFSAPVFDHNGSISLVITAIGPSGTFDIAWDSPLAGAVLDCANGISRRLGYMPSA